VTVTERGFKYETFKDYNDTECSVQKSSLATEDCIWLGAREIGLKKFTPYKGWENIETRGEPMGVSFIANNRMHLSRDQVADLIPILQTFVDTGELP